jgi:hypothetical protein
VNTKEEVKKELMKLYEMGSKILADEETVNNRKSLKGAAQKNIDVSNIPEIQSAYNNWYTGVLPSIKLLVRERYDDFVSYYKKAKQKKEHYNTSDYTISDYLNNDKESLRWNMDFDEFNTFSVKFKNQLAILNACIENSDSLLFNIEHILQYEMYVSELDAARDLLKNGFIRPAGALAGVVLERHLKELCKKHEIKLAKDKPTMANYNESLKDSKAIDLILWRNIQCLGDIRNLCDHPKERGPRADEVEKLIAETEKIIAI